MKIKITIILIMLVCHFSMKATDFQCTVNGQQVTFTILDRNAKTVILKAGTSITSPGNTVSGTLYIPEHPVYKYSRQEWINGQLVTRLYEDKYTLIGVGDYAFSSNKNLSLKLPDNSIEYIGQYAFYGVGSANIPKSVTSIGQYAFAESKIGSIEIPKSIDIIEKGTFSECRNLTDVEIPVSVISIEGEAFSNCKSLTTLTIPESVKTIGQHAFFGCTALQRVRVNNVNKWARTIFADEYSNPFSYASFLYLGNNSEPIEKLVIEGDDPICDYAFAGVSVKRIRVKDNPKIGNKAFWNSIINYLCLDAEVLGDSAFATDVSPNFLPCVYLLQNNPPVINNQFDKRFDSSVIDSFGNVISATVIYVPVGTKQKYSQDKFWGKYSHKIQESNFSGIESFFDPDYENKDIQIMVREVQISPSNTVDLNTGENTQLSVSINPETATYKSVTWSSSNPEVVMVSNTGMVSAVSAGEASIIATANDGSKKHDSVNVIVFDPLKNGEKFTLGDYIYTVISKNEVSIAASSQEIAGDITIPSQAQYGNTIYEVTSISEAGFYACNKVESVSLPNSLSTIGVSAFIGCSNLSSVDIPNTVIKIDDSAFSKCTSLKSVQIPESVLSLGNLVFCGCTSLTEISVPKNVKTIGDYAFKGCNNLKILELGSSVESLGTGCFSGCSNLHFIYSYNAAPPKCWYNTFEEVPLDAYVFIPDAASSSYQVAPDWKNFSNFFEYYPEIVFVNKIEVDKTEIKLNIGETDLVRALAYPAHATYRGLNWTSSNPEIASVSEEGNITAHAIGETSVIVTSRDGSNVSASVNVIVTSDKPAFGETFTEGDFKFTVISQDEFVVSVALVDKKKSGDLIIPTQITFRDYPYEVTTIAKSGFLGCSQISSITIPYSVTTIQETAFYGCTSLTRLHIPESVTEIGSFAFEQCQNLNKIEFDNIESLCSISFSNAKSNPLYYGERLYINNKEITNLIIPNAVTNIKDFAFINCTSLTSIEIPENVATIGTYVFSHCTSLISVKMANSVKSIGNYSFVGCTSLRDFKIPINVKEIADGLFQNCSALTDIEIPESVVSIGEYSFWGCAGLTSIALPSYVATIGDNTFIDCTNIRTISSANPLPPVCGSYALHSIPTAALIYVPVGSTSLYLKAAGWSSFKNYKETDVFPPKETVEITALGSTKLTDGQTVYLSAKLFPFAPANNDFTWHSDNDAIATVEDGLVTAHSQLGVAHISATASNGVKGQVDIEVVATPIRSISIDWPNGRGYLYPGETAAMRATITPANATYQDLFWYVVDESIISVDQNGIVTALSPGNSYVCVRDANNWDMVGFLYVTVKKAKISVESIELENDYTVPLYTDDYNNLLVSKLTLKPKIYPENASVKKVEWTSSNNYVGSVVGSDNTFNAINPGKTTLTCYATDGSGVTASCEVEVVSFGDEEINFLVDGHVVDAESIIPMKIGGTIHVDVNCKLKPFNPRYDDPNIIYSPDIIEITELGQDPIVNELSGYIKHYAVKGLTGGESAFFFIAHNTGSRIWINVSYNSGIIDPSEDSPIEQVIYYDLQGNRITAKNLEPGFYIKKTGLKVEKVFIGNGNINQ